MILFYTKFLLFTTRVCLCPHFYSFFFHKKKQPRWVGRREALRAGTKCNNSIKSPEVLLGVYQGTLA